MIVNNYLPTGGQREVHQWLGIYIGVVVNNSDPTGHKRVIAKVPQVLGSAFTTWCNPVTIPSGSSGPNVNTIIYVMFAGGDPDYPVYFG